MNIDIKWQEPIQLTRFRTIIVNKDALPEELENTAGVYFFSRKFGHKYVPFYIGETTTLRKRLKDHLGTTKLDHVLRELEDAPVAIKGGERYFHFGYFESGSPDKTKKCIAIVQKYLIRTALEKKITQLNKKLTAFKTDTITFSETAKARAIYDKEAIVEASVNSRKHIIRQ